MMGVPAEDPRIGIMELYKHKDAYQLLTTHERKGPKGFRRAAFFRMLGDELLLRDGVPATTPNNK